MTGPEVGGERIATALMFLNEPEFGGETVFPAMPVRQPVFSGVAGRVPVPVTSPACETGDDGLTRFQPCCCRLEQHLSRVRPLPRLPAPPAHHRATTKAPNGPSAPGAA